jgi:hypothetical protein
MVGIPLDGTTVMFVNNESVLTPSTIPHSTLNKRHHALSYHCVRKCIAAKFLYLLHVSGKMKLTDMVTIPLSSASFWPLLNLLFFWKGETIQDIPFSLVIQDLKADTTIG